MKTMDSCLHGLRYQEQLRLTPSPTLRKPSKKDTCSQGQDNSCAGDCTTVQILIIAKIINSWHKVLFSTKKCKKNQLRAWSTFLCPGPNCTLHM